MAQPENDSFFTADADNDDQTLQLQELDLKTGENGNKHHTSKYSLMNEKINKYDRKLVVRRGQEFSLELEFNRPYKKGSDAVKLHFLIQGHEKKGSASILSTGIPAESKESGGIKNHLKTHISYAPYQVHVNVEDAKPSSSTNGWLAHVASSEGNKITVNVKPPAKCAVAKWELELELTSVKSPSSHKYQLKNPIYILFNPWCPEDATYYPDSKGREEYVLAHKGELYKGSHEWPSGLHWRFDQFSPDILDCAMHLLEHDCDQESKLTVRERGDVVKVTRRITSVMNSDQLEPDGVLEGKWLKHEKRGDYEKLGGKNPSDWISSLPILREYYKAKKENPGEAVPVRFGQCWVYSGVVTTVCRALGIPSRSITNYGSGREKRIRGYSFTIDHYYDHETEKRIKSEDDDFVWNFHVWAEAWMKRDDLPDSQLYSGWQAIDATAQEISIQDDKEEMKKQPVKGIYVMGPAPVNACLRGDVHIGYDVDFLFGEVSSDIVHWKIEEGDKKTEDNQSNSHFWRIKSGQIGTKLITYDADAEGLTEVTASYKHPQGSEAAFESMKNALERYGLDSRRVHQYQSSELSLDVNVPQVYIGSPVKFDVIVRNKTGQKLKGTGLIQVYTAQEMGAQEASDLVAEFQLEFSVRPNSHEIYPFIVEYEKYRDVVKSANRALLIDYSASAKDKDFYDFGKTFFCFKKPVINVEAHRQSASENEIIRVTATFKNTLGISIDEGTFEVSSPDLKAAIEGQTVKELEKQLDPNQETSVEFEMTPTGQHGMHGSHSHTNVSVHFRSDHPFICAYGSTEVQLEE